ncbi:hypothetical protein BGZ65_002027, partial [Modicella reniformis]
YKVKLFKIEYVAGLYVWTEVASGYLPRDHQDLDVIPRFLGLITRLKGILDNINVEAYLRTPPPQLPEELLPDDARPQPVGECDPQQAIVLHISPLIGLREASTGQVEAIASDEWYPVRRRLAQGHYLEPRRSS